MTSHTQKPFWWQKAVIYQIYPRSFQDSNGDGIGDLAGITQRLDYLAELGVGAIWLSPFYRSPMKDFGYDVADYCDVDPIFGTLEDFDALVAGAHERGIKVIVDWVPNHTSDEHPWFLESRSSRDNPKRDWYIWRDAKPDGSPPNNWGSHFGGSTWEWDEKTGQYYFHQFVVGQPDLNWRNPDVRQAMYDVLRFWMRRGVDGFRMDVINLIIKHPDMPDQPLIAGATGRAENDLYGRQEHLYDQDYEGIHEVMREIRAVLDEFPEKVAIGEVWLPLDRWKLYYGTAEQPELHLPFNFRLTLPEVRWEADALRHEIALIEAAVPPHGFPNYVLNNHDIKRFTTRIGQTQARVAALLLLTLRGTPTLYNGEEIGMVDGVIAEDQVQDPQGLILGVAYTRDVCRTPMQWDDSPQAGFTTGKAWLPVNPDYVTRNVQAQRADARSMLALYRKLIALRSQESALITGAYASVDAPQGVLAYTRSDDSATYLVALNLTGEVKTFTSAHTGQIVIDTGLQRAGEGFAGELTLAGHEGVLVKLS